MTQEDRDRAHRLGTLAGRAKRGLGGACPYNANGTGDEKALAAVFVRGFVAAGGSVDGLDYGDGPSSSTSSAARAPRPGAHRAGGAYGHLGLPL